MAITKRSNGSRKSTASTLPVIRLPRQYDNSDKNAISKVVLNYPILVLGTVSIAILIFWHREMTKNVHTSEPILTVHPSTDADVSTVQNLVHLVEFDQSIFDTAKAKQLN